MIAIGYHVSNSHKERWFKNQYVQHKLYPGAISGYISLVVCENGNGIIADYVVETKMLWNGKYSQSKSKNLMIDTASNIGADWLIQLDSDFILISNLQIKPISGYGTALVHWQTEEAARNFDFSYTTFKASSIMILDKRILHNKQIRYCEEFIDYGYEDIDFNENVLAKNNNIHQTSNSLRGLHLWHPQSEVSASMAKNKLLYEQRRGM